MGSFTSVENVPPRESIALRTKTTPRSNSHSAGRTASTSLRLRAVLLLEEPEDSSADQSDDTAQARHRAADAADHLANGKTGLVLG